MVVIGSMKCKLSEYAYAAINGVGQTVSFAPDLNTLAEAIKGVFKREACGAVVLETQVGQEKWFLYISTYKTGDKCDTTAAVNDIKNNIARHTRDIESRGMVAYCIHLNHGGTWNADVGIQRGDVPGSAYSNIVCDGN